MEKMEILYNGGRPDKKPDGITFTNVIRCMAMSDPDGLERSLKLLPKMEEHGDVRPNVYTYNW